MCGRFTHTVREIGDVARALSASLAPGMGEGYRPRYNVAPGNEHFVLRLEGSGGALLEPARFGFDGPRGQLLINARAETADRLGTFRDAFASSRCVVPADGFYEWRGSRRDRRPLWFHRPDRGLLLMAGLVRRSGRALEFVILTTAANATLAPIHDRMPALLSETDAHAWLNSPDPALLRPAPDALLQAREVSARVNSVAHDDPECLAAPEPRAQLVLL